MNKIWWYNLQLLLFTVIVSSCVYEDEALDPAPESLFITYTSAMGVDDIINPESNYIAVIGDIQEYISPYSGLDCYSYYLNTMAWIYTQQKVYNNIKCVLLDGDMTQNNISPQWARYKAGASFIEDTLPLLVCTGNHDYDWVMSKENKWIIDNRESSMINNYFPGKALETIITYQFESGHNENYVAKLMIADEEINMLVLEFAPRKEVIMWANDIVKNCPNEKFILMTHELLSKYGLLTNSNSTAEYQFAGTASTYTTPKEVWENLVYPNNNIICTLCGHNDYLCHFKYKNIVGREVSNILFNLQYQPNCGDGKIMLWEFPLHEDFFKVFVYNTINRSIETNDVGSFNVYYK